GFRFPVIVKPNIGGSGAGIRRFETPAQLDQAASAGALDLGIDQTALVQEYIPAAEQRIVRVEVLGGRYLYAIRIYTPGDSFNLCPADVCQTVGGAELARAACPVDAPKNNLRVEGYTPPPEIVDQVECIMRAAHIDVGGVEYMIDARDGRLYFYDINALSNFVDDAPRDGGARGGDGAARADGRRAADVSSAGARRQAGSEHRPHQRGAGHPQRGVVVVGRRGAPVRRRVRPARRALRPHRRVARGGERDVGRAPVQLRGAILHGRERDPRAEARAAAAPDAVRRR